MWRKLGLSFFLLTAFLLPPPPSPLPDVRVFLILLGPRRHNNKRKKAWQWFWVGVAWFGMGFPSSLVVVVRRDGTVLVQGLSTFQFYLAACGGGTGQGLERLQTETISRGVWYMHVFIDSQGEPQSSPLENLLL